MVLRQNFSQFNLDIRQLLADLQCPSFIFSCSSLHRDCHSGYYLSRASNGSAVRVYCDMTLSCGNITGGWMRVAELKMTDTSQQCPGILWSKMKVVFVSAEFQETDVTQSIILHQTYRIRVYVAELKPTKLVPLMDFENTMPCLALLLLTLCGWC